MAARLDKVVPAGLSVRAHGASVDVYSATDDRHASVAAEIIIERDGRTLAERITTAAWAILNAAQGGVMELLMEEWPVGPSGKAADPGTRFDGDQLLMWFGEERRPVVALPPLNLSEVGGAA